MSKGTILLVEDELFLQELYCRILRKEGYTVLTASDGEEGILLARDNPNADVLLLDIMLPKIHGVDVLKKLKSEPETKKIPVIILSNLTEDGIIHQTLGLGAKGYFIKLRIPPEKLVSRIEECIASLEVNS